MPHCAHQLQHVPAVDAWWFTYSYIQFTFLLKKFFFKSLCVCGKSFINGLMLIFSICSIYTREVRIHLCEEKLHVYGCIHTCLCKTSEWWISMNLEWKTGCVLLAVGAGPCSHTRTLTLERVHVWPRCNYSQTVITQCI